MKSRIQKDLREASVNASVKGQSRCQGYCPKKIAIIRQTLIILKILKSCKSWFWQQNVSKIRVLSVLHPCYPRFREVATYANPENPWSRKFWRWKAPENFRVTLNPNPSRAIQLSRISLVGGVCNPDSCGKQYPPIAHNALKKPKTEWLWQPI